jgi:hypothetical protein
MAGNVRGSEVVFPKIFATRNSQAVYPKKIMTVQCTLNGSTSLYWELGNQTERMKI